MKRAAALKSKDKDVRMVLQKKRKGAITMKRKLWGLLLTAVLFTSAFGVLPVWAAEADGSFTVADTEISINGEATPVLAGLGKADNFYEAENCNYQGKEKIYVYKDVEISVYPMDGVDCISSVYLKTDSAQTAEGISIGSDTADMEEAYGSDYTEAKGVYTYQYDDFTLTFYTNRQGVINGIEYTSGQ